MKAEFRTKLIQHLLNKKNSEKGFTLIELLVVVIIIGILAAIALPAFLNEANRAREAEAKSFLSNYLTGQASYYNRTGGFAPQFAFLALGISTTTDNYTFTYTVNTDKAKVGIDNNLFVQAKPTTSSLKSAAGVMNVGVIRDAAGIGAATLFQASAMAKKPPVDGGVLEPDLKGTFTLSVTTNPVIIGDFEAIRK